MAAIANINQLQGPTTVLELGIPAEGPKCLPVTLDFGANDSYVLDYQNMQARGFMAMVQTIYVDNRNSDTPITIQMGRTGQIVVAPGRSQGYYPVLQPSPVVMSFTSVGAGAVATVFLINSFIQGCNWRTTT